MSEFENNNEVNENNMKGYYQPQQNYQQTNRIPTSDKALTSMILGIVSIVSASLVLGIIGLVFSMQAKKEGNVTNTHNIGFITSIIGIVLSCLSIIIVIIYFAFIFSMVTSFTTYY